jgi:uncharacterized membrane protein
MQSRQLSRLTGAAILCAIVVALQVVATFIRFGPFSITLALFPIIVGAAIYGPRTGAVLGGAFGVVVLIMTINGADAGANILWLARPAVTAVLCLLKGVLAGWGAGLIYAFFSKRDHYIGTFVAAFVCPVINTGIFIAAMSLFYRDTLIEWAAGASLLYYSLVGLTGINFLMELGVNLVLASAAVRIILTAKRKAA